MAKSAKKVSISKIDEVLGERFLPTVVDEWYGVELTINRTISIVSAMEFVRDVTSLCMDDEMGFLPEIEDFAIRCNIVTRYANVSLPDKLEHRYAMVYGNDLVDFITARVDAQQLRVIINAIDRKIEHLCAANLSTLNKELGGLVDAFTELRDKTEKVFEGVDAEGLNKLVGSLKENGIPNERAIVTALMEARGKEENSEEG